MGDPRRARADEGFRPYLLTPVRRTAWRRQARARQVCLVDDGELDLPDLHVEMELLDPTGDDTVLRAFRSLPERWQKVLWHTIVLGRSVSELAAELGLSPNATSALGVRAREGLRKAYLRANGAEAAFATAA